LQYKVIVRDLDHALGDIAAIRGQMARAAEFRGYGPLALAATALLALAGAWAQPRWVALPLAHPDAYAWYWSAFGAAAAALIAAEAVARARRLHGGLADDMIRAAVEQFLPAAVAGGLLTVCLLHAAPASAPLLPGLWQILFSLGVFATCRVLPRPVLAVGVWYLLTGLLCIASPGPALNPWWMGAPFAVGQAMAAVILWRASSAFDSEALHVE